MGKVTLYLVEHDDGCDVVRTPEQANIHLSVGHKVYVIDAEEYVPAPKPKRWTVVGSDGYAIATASVFNLAMPHTGRSISFNTESDAICLLDLLTRGGMTGLKIVKLGETVDDKRQ